MDWIQVGIAIFIPLVVSFFAWALTYIIPYIYPDFVSKAVIKLKEDNPKDPIEIGIIINQFSKYDDWKRLTAYKRIEQMFIQKVKEIEISKELEWDKLKKNVIRMPLINLLDKLNLVLLVLKDDEYEEKNNIKLTSDDIKDHFKTKISVFEENQAKYSEITKKSPNAVIWGELYISPEYIKNYKRKDFVLKIEEVALFDSKYTTIDGDGSMSIEDFLKFKNHYKPEKQSLNEILTTFNDVILYIDYPHSKREELTYRLALGLSDHEKSFETLNKLLGEVKGRIWNKDYEEYKKRLNVW